MLVVLLLDVLTSNILLKYKRIIQNKNRKRIFVKKRKNKILINTAVSSTSENFRLRERINYITDLAVLLALLAALSSVLLPCFLLACCCAGCCVLYLLWCVVSLTALLIAPNNPFNTLVSVYIRSIDIVLIITIITRYKANK